MSVRINPVDYYGQPVRFNGDGWLHATEIAERFGKRLDHWLETAETLEYVRALDGEPAEFGKNRTLRFSELP